MDLQAKIIHDAKSFEAFCALLQSSNLPYNDLNFKNHLLIGYYDEDKLVGTGGLEFYGEYTLLRSLAVNDSVRGLSIGSFITNDLISQAKRKQLKSIYLLTESAQGFFRLRGFKIISREEVPSVLKSSSEFSYTCPASAVCMVLVL